MPALLGALPALGFDFAFDPALGFAVDLGAGFALDFDAALDFFALDLPGLAFAPFERAFPPLPFDRLCEPLPSDPVLPPLLVFVVAIVSLLLG